MGLWSACDRPYTRPLFSGNLNLEARNWSLKTETLNPLIHPLGRVAES
jgi:hypothetical protein